MNGRTMEEGQIVRQVRTSYQICEIYSTFVIHGGGGRRGGVKARRSCSPQPIKCVDTDTLSKLALNRATECYSMETKYKNFCTSTSPHLFPQILHQIIRLSMIGLIRRSLCMTEVITTNFMSKARRTMMADHDLCHTTMLHILVILLTHSEHFTVPMSDVVCSLNFTQCDWQQCPLNPNITYMALVFTHCMRKAHPPQY